ncbi:MAG: 3'-5' exonuclease [Kiritimatiellae bacterium]|nr:3'-5' exonuclease [Kiritimatiellia bacterium]
MRISEKNLLRMAAYARNGRVVVFDTETTGCSAYDEICQIAAAEYEHGALSRTFARYICPTCEMNPWAEAVHGLSMDFLSEHGLEPEEAMLQFFEFVGDDVLLVAHNATFDMRMVRQECRKFGLAFAPRGVETCDTLTLSRRLRPDLPSHKLSYLIGALDIDGVNSHDALDDALACAGVFFSFIKETMAKQNSRALPGDFFGIMCAHETGHDES